MRFFLLIVFSFTSGGNAWSESSPATAERALGGLGEGARAGVWVKNLETGKVLIDRSSSEPLLPASVTKLVTAAASLEKLGPEKTFSTRVTLGPSSIYIEGRGDPFLVEERLFLFARKLANVLEAKRPGKKDWELVAVPGYFDEDDFGGDRGERNSDQPYNAGVSDLAVNFNSIELIVTPGAREGDPASIRTVPELPGLIQISGHVQTGGKAKAIEFDRSGGAGGKERFTARGKIPLHSEPVSIYRRVREPRLFALEAFREALALQGREIRGRARIATAQEADQARRGDTVLTFESEPLGDLIRGMNRFSNNFMAEQILKTLGAETSGRRGSYESGTAALADFMKSLGVKPDEARLMNGSGLTDANRLSARALGRVLESVWTRGNVLPELWASLAMPGGMGSMKRRVGDWSLDPADARRLRAKTGTLYQGTVVSSMAGYVAGLDGAHYAFVVIMNRSESSSLDVLRRFQDSQGRFVRELLKW